jgi:hypothetical protein
MALRWSLVVPVGPVRPVWTGKVASSSRYKDGSSKSCCPLYSIRESNNAKPCGYFQGRYGTAAACILLRFSALWRSRGGLANPTTRATRAFLKGGEIPPLETGIGVHHLSLCSLLAPSWQFLDVTHVPAIIVMAILLPCPRVENGVKLRNIT